MSSITRPDVDPRAPTAAWAASWAAAWAAAASAAGGLSPAAGAAAATAREQGLVLTVVQVGEHGVGRAERRRLQRAGVWVPARYGVVAVVSPQRVGAGIGADEHVVARATHALRATGLALVRPDHVVAGPSAAILHGLPTMRVPPEPVLMTRRPVTTGHRAPGHLMRPKLSDPEIASWFGAPVTTPARTVVDLARLEPWSGRMAADAALRHGLATAEDLDRAVRAAAGFRWIRRARDVLAAASPLAESPLESVTHLQLCADGFPPPVLQARVTGADGVVYRVDFYWPQFGLVLEADGAVKYAADGRLLAEKRREHALRTAGYTVERVMWDDVTRRWPETAARLRRHMHRTP